jgi:hypothetical protein
MLKDRELNAENLGKYLKQGFISRFMAHPFEFFAGTTF